HAERFCLPGQRCPRDAGVHLLWGYRLSWKVAPDRSLDVLGCVDLPAAYRDPLRTPSTSAHLLPVLLLASAHRSCPVIKEWKRGEVAQGTATAYRFLLLPAHRAG